MPRKPAFISWDREKEARIQSRMLDILEARFRRRIAKTLDREAQDLVAAYSELGFMPPPTDAHFRAIRDLYEEMALASARTFGRRIITQGKAKGYVIETKEEEGGFAAFFRSLANAWINSEPIRRRIQSVTETTRDRIVNQIARGQEEGFGIEKIARGIIEDTPEISRFRARVIARTETHGASNFAMHETAKSTGLDLVKEWVAIEDHRTRKITGASPDQYDHWAMDGQQRPMDEPFAMPQLGTTETLAIMYPGEAGKPGGAVINCRCASIHSVPDLD